MKKFLLITLLTLLCAAAHAQPKQDSIKPTVGLVLSGGGAKGLYHIGVIKALEQHNIPIDYISGTSMGAIVAGLYAAGYTPWEMEQIALGPEISQWVSGKIDPKYKSTYNLPIAREQMLSISQDIKDIKGKAQLQSLRRDSNMVVEFYSPESHAESVAKVISSLQLDLGLMQYFSGANAVAKNNFDSLYVPFRCVSVDAVTKTERLWDHGELSQAIRASMAIPVVFSPVIVDSSVMFDGGMYNNFPWQDSYNEWKPDLIIGSRCVSGDVMDLSSVTGQLMSLIIKPTDYNIPDSIGVLIGRGVDVSTLEFDKARYIIDLGYKDAIEAMPMLLARTPRLEDPSERETKRLAFKSKMPTLVFNREQVRAELQNSVPEDSMSEKAIKRYQQDKQKEALKAQRAIDKGVKAQIGKYTDLIGIEEFKQLYLQTIEDGDAQSSFAFADYNDTTGYYDLRTSVSHNPQLTFNGGINISSSSINQIYLGAQYKYNKRHTYFYNLDGFVGAFYNSAHLSNRINFYQGKNKFYLYNTITYNNIDYLKANDQQYSYSQGFLSSRESLNELYASSTFGFPIGNRNKVEARLAIGWDGFYSNAYSSLDDVEQKVDHKSDLWFTTLNMRMVTTDIFQENYPTRGYRQEVSVMGALGSERSSLYFEKEYTLESGYQSWMGARYSLTNYFEFGKAFSMGVLAEGQIAIEPEIAQVNLSRIAPRFAPTQYTKTIFIPELEQFNYIAGGIMPVIMPFKSFEIRPEAYMMWSDIFDQNSNQFHYIAALSAVYKFPIVTVALSYNYLNATSIKQHYVMLNLGVMMFNPRGIVY